MEEGEGLGTRLHAHTSAQKRLLTGNKQSAAAAGLSSSATLHARVEHARVHRAYSIFRGSKFS